MVLDNYYELLKNVKEIATRYFFYQEKLRKGNEGMLLAEDISDAKSFIERCNDSFNSLDAIDKEIINNEFFYQDAPNWWKTRYGKGDFERRKKVAMKEFVLNFVKGGENE